MGELHKDPDDTGIDLIGTLKGLGSSVLKEVIKLTPFGKSHEEYSHRELLELYVDYVDTLIARDPSFGKTPENFKNLHPDCKDACLTVFDYLYDNPEPYGYPVVDTHALYHDIGFEGRDVADLIQGEVLKDISEERADSYVLQQPYYDFWIAGSANLARQELEEIYRFEVLSD